MPTPTQKQRAYYATLRKLTREQVLAARAQYTQTTPQPTIDALAHQFKVSYNTMYRALKSSRLPEC